MFTHLNTEFVVGWIKCEREEKRVSAFVLFQSFLMSRGMEIIVSVLAVAYSTTHQWFCLYTKILRERRDREKLVRFRLETADNTVRFIL